MGLKVILFGATGMVGQGVLRECLLDPGVETVLTVGRKVVSQTDPKLRQIEQPDLLNLAAIEPELAGYDACFFCLGVTSVGMTEADYTRLTYDLTLSIARTLVRLQPAMTFIYVSGASTSLESRQMWARVKGRTEAAILEMGFKRAYAFRPGYIQPLHGVQSKVKAFRIVYAVLAPLCPILKAMAPGAILSTETIGRAMIRAASQGAPKPILEAKDINLLAGNQTR